MSDLPERINVMRVITYDVASVIEQLQAERDSEVVYDRHTPHRFSDDEPFTIDEVIERV